MFIEKHALSTWTGPQGIRQVNVRGLVATAFTHRDSRAGDPDLHTHVAVGEQGPDPRRTLAVDRRPGAVQGQRRGVGDLQHRARAAPPRHVRGAVC